MRILSLNCWSGRVSGLAAYLAGMDADIYCLQEVLNSPPETPDELIFDEQGSTTEPQRAKLFAELCGSLPEHTGVHLPAARGYLHDNATTRYNAMYGIATFVRKTIPVVGSNSAFVHGSYRAGGWDPPPLPRQGHALRVWDHSCDKPLVVAHMHGMWVSNGKVDTPERASQAAKFYALVQSVRRKDDRLVMCGDFNILPDSAAFSLWRQGLGVEDLVVGRGHTDTRTSFYKKYPRYADYMLASPDVEVQTFSVVEQPEVSDHRPLVLDLK